MTGNDGLDSWIENPKPRFPGTHLQDHVVLDSLKEKISELEAMQEQIRQEIARLKSLQISR